MGNLQWRRLALAGFLAAVVGCGGGSHAPAASLSSSPASVTISGRITQRGTRGPILVFAYTDLGPNDDAAAHEPASLGTVAADGSFEIDMPAAASLTLVFLSDGANDGVVDQGDPVALLRSPDLVDLQAGDQVRILGAKVDFTTHRVNATVEIARASGGPSAPGVTAEPTN